VTTVRVRSTAGSWLIRLTVFAVFAVAWQLAAISSDNLLFASFTDSVKGFFELAFRTGALWQPLLVSNQAMVIGYIASIVVGLPLGLAAGRSRILDRVMDPYIAILIAIPIAPLIPIVIVAVGLGLTSRVLVVFFFTFVFILVNTRAGVRKVDPSIVEMAKSFGASEMEAWRLVVIPAAVPAIFAGLRIGLNRAIAGMVIVELLLIASGIGRLLLETSGRLQGDLLFGLVIAIVLEAQLLLSLMRMVERKVAPWAN
jgi:NitT/TauT family transport system permease protein